MNLSKNNKTILLYPAALLTILSVLLQIVSIPVPSIAKLTEFISFILTQIVAPITFFIIVYMLWKEPKPKVKAFRLILLIFGILILNYLLSMSSSLVLNKFFTQSAANPLAGEAKNNYLISILALGWAMLGEEAIKLSLFFILFKSLHYNKENKSKYWISWIIVAVIFGLLHLSTYQYNFLQCIFTVGLPAILYAYLWKRTENPLIMWGTHYLYDIILISISLLV